MERTWEISDLDGSNKRTVTLAQYRAELDAAKTKAEATMAKHEIPKLYRDLIKQMRKEADLRGDGHAGWAALKDHWTDMSIAQTLAKARTRDIASALKVLSATADAIVRNMAAIREERS